MIIVFNPIAPKKFGAMKLAHFAYNKPLFKALKPHNSIMHQELVYRKCKTRPKPSFGPLPRGPHDDAKLH